MIVARKISGRRARRRDRRRRRIGLWKRRRAERAGRTAGGGRIGRAAQGALYASQSDI